MAARSTFVWGANEKPVFCGDSLVAGGISGPGGISVSWDVPLQANMNASLTGVVSCKCVDLGRSSTWDIQGVSSTQMNYWAANYSTMALGKGATIVFIAWGVNDASAGTLPSTTAANLATGVNGCWASEPNIKFVVINVMENGELWPDGAGATDAAMDATNAAIKAECDVLSSSGSICYIDVRTWWFTVIPVYNPTNVNGLHTLTVDNLHLNGQGALIAANYIWTNRVAA